MSTKTPPCRAAIAAMTCVLASAAIAEPVEITVTATAETAPMSGDADDPAIWVNPADPVQSRILGTDNQVGLMVYDLAGDLLQDFLDGELGNVDTRPFEMQGRIVTVAGASKGENDTLLFYIMDDNGLLRRAQPFAHPGAPENMKAQVDGIQGFAMQRMPESGRVFALVNYQSGHVFQWELIDENGILALKLARQWQVPGQPEGIVSDDRAGHIYLGEKNAAIWRYPGDPEAEPAGEKVAEIGTACLPVEDVEGLAIYNGEAVRYLVASSQGIDRAAIYELPGFECVGLIEVTAGVVDGVTETDGLAVTATPLPGYPEGLLVIMDDQNPGSTTNFKLVDWSSIAGQLRLLR